MKDKLNNLPDYIDADNRIPSNRCLYEGYIDSIMGKSNTG